MARAKAGKKTKSPEPPEDRDPKKARLLPRALPPLALFILGTVLALAVSRAGGLPVDDAYIHLTFARNLSDGLGPCFNPGEFSLGFTSPLWAAFLASCEYLMDEAVPAGKVMGAISLGAAAALAYLIVFISVAGAETEQADSPPSGPSRDSHDDDAEISARAFRRTGLALAAGLCVALSGNLAWLAGSGMEAITFLALGMAAIFFLWREEPRPLLGGLFLGLCVLTRPTGVLLLAIAAAGAALFPKRRRDMLMASAIGMALNLPWLAYSLAKTGHLLPPTRAGKLASNLFNSGLAAKGIKVFLKEHLVYFFVADKAVLVLALIGAAAALLALALAWRGRRQTPADGRDADDAGTGPFGTLLAASRELTAADAVALWAIGHFLNHALFFRSTAALTPYHNLRYQPMLIPASAVFAALALSRLAELVRARADRAGLRAKSDSKSASAGAAKKGKGAAAGHDASGVRVIDLAALLLVVGPALAGSLDLPNWRALYRVECAHLEEVHRRAAVYARDKLPPDARIACLDIGALGYYSDRYVIDLGGLIDPDALPHLEKSRTGPYIMDKNATHLFHMNRPDSEVVTGAMADNGLVYDLKPLGVFQFPDYSKPVLLHSLAIEVYEVHPIKAP